MTGDWNRLPPIEVKSPALAVLGEPNGLWAGGYGGVAWYAEETGWTPLISGLAITSVTALAYDNGCLVAGGVGGIARSTDGGRTWQQSATPGSGATVAAIVPSPGFADDGTALAATLNDGILRTTDAGRTWQPSTFGLHPREVLALAWGAGEAVVAVTTAGLYRSPNAGRSWRVRPGTQGTAFAAIATLPDRTAVAVPEDGPLLRSTDNLNTWSPFGRLPDGIRPWALAAVRDDCLLLATADHGVIRSGDGGSTWTSVIDRRALALSTVGTLAYAGTTTGVAASDDGGHTWTDLPAAPLHDLRRLLVLDDCVVVAGFNSPGVVCSPDGRWSLMQKMPLPLTCIAVSPDGAIFGSMPDGLFRSGDRGATWEPVIEGSAGHVTAITFLPDGAGWAGVTPDDCLLRTDDGGRSWERSPSPFGVLPLVALQATLERDVPTLMAATYDERQRAVTVWRSDDGGAHWTRGADSATTWPVVATASAPPLLTVGNVITVRQPDGTWRQNAVGATGIRRVVTAGATLIALAVDGILRSDDLAATWARADEGLAVDQILDVALDGGVLYALLIGGRLWSRPL